MPCAPPLAGPDRQPLARRQAKLYSAYFNRRLTVEGGTELGPPVKESRDGIDLPALLRPAGIRHGS